MQFQIPELAFAGLPISGLLGLAVWMIRKHGIAAAMSTLLLLFGSLTYAVCMVAFTCRLFDLAYLCEDAPHWLACGIGIGTVQVVGSAFARYLLPSEKPPTKPATSA